MSGWGSITYDLDNGDNGDKGVKGEDKMIHNIKNMELHTFNNEDSYYLERIMSSIEAYVNYRIANKK